MYIGNYPRSLTALFLTNHAGLNNFGRESPRKHFCQVILKSVHWWFLKYSIQIYIVKISPPLAAMFFFLTNQNGLNNLGRGLPKKHFWKIILKLVQWLLTRNLFKFLVKKSIFSSCDLDMQWTETIWTTLKENKPRIISVVWLKSNQWLRRRCPLKKLFTDERMDGHTHARTDGKTHDRRRTICDHKSSPCHLVTGELKIEKNTLNISS